MVEAIKDEIAAIVAKDAWTVEDSQALRAQLYTGASAAFKVKGILGDLERADAKPSGAAAVKIGMVRYMLCQFEDALAALSAGTDNKDRHYIQAMCLKQLRQFDKAGEEFARAGERGWDAVEIALAVAEVNALGGKLAEAQKALDKLEKNAGETVMYHYVRGLILELGGWGEEACEAYVQARSIDTSNVDVTFRLAYYYDLHGEEEQAVELYKECTTRPPVHSSALLNLAVLYEDAGDYDAAIVCLKRILATNPTHQRARLFIKDVEASKTMYFDEDQARRIAKHNAVMDIPVTDFELSVRARNCLKKMNIRCLGDLVMTTETELLAYKNFGETSLREIKEMLTAKGLRLGQGLEDADNMFRLAPEEEEEHDAQGVLATPLDRIEFSVRARSAIDDLGMKVLGDLAAKSEAELLACKNLGQSTLNEMRQRLGEYGLHLREPE